MAVSIRKSTFLSSWNLRLPTSTTTSPSVANSLFGKRLKVPLGKGCRAGNLLVTNSFDLYPDLHFEAALLVGELLRVQCEEAVVGVRGVRSFHVLRIEGSAKLLDILDFVSTSSVELTCRRLGAKGTFGKRRMLTFASHLKFARVAAVCRQFVVTFTSVVPTVTFTCALTVRDLKQW